jgi:hypothetical protein
MGSAWSNGLTHRKGNEPVALLEIKNVQVTLRNGHEDQAAIVALVSIALGLLKDEHPGVLRELVDVCRGELAEFGPTAVEVLDGRGLVEWADPTTLRVSARMRSIILACVDVRDGKIELVDPWGKEA